MTEEKPQINNSEEQEETKFFSNKKVQWDTRKMQERVYNLEAPKIDENKTEAQRAYDHIFSHKEGFLPPKRNLYEALDSQEGYHRFG